MQDESKIYVTRSLDRTYLQVRKADNSYVRNDAVVEPPGIDLPDGSSLVTRQKGDARYITAAGGGVASLSLGINCSGACVAGETWQGSSTSSS